MEKRFASAKFVEDFGDINRLFTFAREMEVGISVELSQASGNFEVQTTSHAVAEEFAMKRCNTVDDFINAWEEHHKEALAHEREVRAK